MKKKVLSLALALVMCLGLTVPAMAAETHTYGDDGFKITNVIKEEEPEENEQYSAKLTCVAPVSFICDTSAYKRFNCELGIVPVEGEMENIENYDFNKQSAVVFAEPGTYEVFFDLRPKPEYEEEEADLSFNIYFITVLADTPKPADPPATTDPSTTTPVEPAVATPTNDKLTVNGQPADPTVYKIGGSNYFKIRDVAALLNGTEKQFDVGYDNALKSVTVETGKGYAKEPTDLAGAATGGSQTANPSNDAIYVNGEKINAEVYKIGGGNYFKLRDLGKALNFYVGWEQGTGMYIDTSKPYSE